MEVFFKPDMNPESDKRPESDKYNLMEETYGKKWSTALHYETFLTSDCNTGYVNTNRLPQDHPCVIDIIRSKYLQRPTNRSVPYKLSSPQILDPSDGQSRAVLRLLRNQTNGVFVECGAFDGEFLSNTLFMEKSLNWSGLLIEPDKNAFNKLKERNRKAFISPLCLSTKPYPMEVMYNATTWTLSSIMEQTDDQFVLKTNYDVQEEGDIKIHNKIAGSQIYRVQCFPLYSILLAMGTTEIDYFSLDVEGSEYKILKTIPWHKVNIKIVTAEWDHLPEGEEELTRLMERNKFIKFGLISLSVSREVVYVQDVLHDYRLTEEDFY